MSVDYRTAYLTDTSTGRDDTTGDANGIFADKRFTVPTDRYWRIMSLRAALISSAAVGNRQLVFTVDDSGSTDPFIEIRGDTVQAASVTRYYQIAPGLTRETGFLDSDWITMPIPDVELPPGSVIRLFDEAAIGTTAAPDDLEMFLIVQARGGK